MTTLSMIFSSLLFAHVTYAGTTDDPTQQGNGQIDDCPPPVVTGPACLLFGDEQFELNGSLRVDGYDSADGYQWHASYYGTDRAPVAVGCSNAEMIDLFGSVDFWGELRAGPGGSVDMVGSARWAEDNAPLEAFVAFPPALAPQGPEVQHHGAIVDEPTSVSGTVFFGDGLTVVPGGRLVVDGPTEIVVAGPLTLGPDAILNPGRDPHDLTITVVGPHDVLLDEANTIYGALYAPESYVRVDGSLVLWGALISGALDMHGSVWAHVDVSLEERFPSRVAYTAGDTSDKPNFGCPTGPQDDEEARGRGLAHPPYDQGGSTSDDKEASVDDQTTDATSILGRGSLEGPLELSSCSTVPTLPGMWTLLAASMGLGIRRRR